MSQKYRELMRQHGEIELKFPKVKAWREDMLARAEKDDTFPTDADFNHAVHTIWRDYYNMIGQYTLERLDIEEQIRDELEVMNTLPVHQRVGGVYRLDGKVDFGKAFLFLADQIQKIYEKIDETNRVIVDSE